jgi:hypothetical protein
MMLLPIPTSSMVRGPACRRKPCPAESEISDFESAVQNHESNDRNLFRVAGTLSHVKTTCSTANGVDESSYSNTESKIRYSESNERNLFQVAGDLL